LLGGLLVVVPELHFPENAFALQLLLQRAQRLIDIVIANNYLQAEPPFMRLKSLSSSETANGNRADQPEPVTVVAAYSSCQSACPRVFRAKTARFRGVFVAKRQ